MSEIRKGVGRFDFRPLEKATKTDNGFLKAPVFATRTGVFKYLKADGTVIHEYRPPAEVFNADSMASLQGVPLTNRHPTEMVNSKNARKLTVGFTSDIVQQDGNFVKTAVTVSDQGMINEIEKDGITQVSCGYKCDLEFSPGITPEGEKYDAIQKNIRYNHLAVVDRGRAGPDVKLRLDSEDAVLDDECFRKENFNQPPKREDVMGTAQIKLDGVGYDVDSSVAGPINTALKNARLDGLKEGQKEMDEEKKKSKKAMDEMQAKIDGLESDLKEAKESKLDDKDIHAKVVARAALMDSAKAHLDKETKMDEMSDLEIKKAVVAKVCDGLDLEEKSEDYIQARFDHIVATKPAEKKDGKVKDALKDLENKKQDGEPLSYEEARAASMKADSEAWKQPIGKTLNK